MGFFEGGGRRFFLTRFRLRGDDFSPVVPGRSVTPWVAASPSGADPRASAPSGRFCLSLCPKWSPFPVRRRRHTFNAATAGNCIADRYHLTRARKKSPILAFATKDGRLLLMGWSPAAGATW